MLLAARLRRRTRWWIAVSGGVDSAALAAEAARAVGAGNVQGITGVSPAVPDVDRKSAQESCRLLGIAHRFVETRELEREAYLRNGPDRCFHCRTELFSLLRKLAEEASGGVGLAYGAIVDDLGDHRPGMQAAADFGVEAPLLDAGIGKADVREIARIHRLPVSHKPAAACLASRIRTGIPVSADRLGQVERAEAALAALGFSGFRVRHHGELARIEFAPGDLERVLSEGVSEEVRARVAAAGFRFVTVDLAGYRPAGTGDERPATLREP